MQLDNYLIRKAIHGYNLLWRCTFVDELVTTPFYDLVYTFGVESKFMSCAQRLNIPTDHLDNEIQLIEKFYQQRNKPASFYLDPSVQPGNLEQLLVAKGYAEFKPEEEIWWILDYSTMHLPEINIPGLEIVECKNREQFEDHLKAAMQGYHDFKFWASLLSKSYRKPIDGVNVVHYVAYMDGLPVGCATLGTYFDIALLINVAVIPDYRRKGIHTALMTRRILDSQKLGANCAFYTTDFDNHASIATGQKVGFIEAFRRHIFSK